MNDELEYFKGSKNPKYFAKSLVHDLRFYQDNPFYFHPAGIWCFTGPQGSGKSLSATKCAKRLIRDYPGAILVSNIALRNIDFPVIPFTDYSQIVTMDNGIYGIIFLIDELHILWNSLESKKIPFEEMAAFCTQFVDDYNQHTGQNLSREEYKQMLLQYYPTLKRWKK